MTEILIGTNLLTLVLLGITLRANWLWRQASRKPRHYEAALEAVCDVLSNAEAFGQPAESNDILAAIRSRL